MSRAGLRSRRILVLGWAIVLGAVAGCSSPSAEHKEHAPPKYGVAFHDHDGKHKHETLDLANPAHKDKLHDLLEHGHVVEIENATPPSPQKLFSLRADLGIWSLLIFALLFWVLSRLAWPKMLAGLQKRESNIQNALQDAQKARDEAAAMRAQYQKDIDQAHLKVKEILDEARRDASATKDDMIAAARTEIQTERDRAHREIAVATDQAMQSIWSKAADLATQVSAAALGKQLDGAMHRRLIDESLNELKAASRN